MLKWLNSQLKVIKVPLKYNSYQGIRMVHSSAEASSVSAFQVSSLISSPPSMHPSSAVISQTTSPELSTSNLWQGGKASGNIQLNGNTYYIRIHSKTLETVRIADFGSHAKAFTYAKKVLYDHCRDKNLLKNTYKISQDLRGIYLDVKIGDMAFKCDYDFLELVDKHVWKYNKQEGLVYTHICVDNSKRILYFHRAIFDLNNRFRVDHADGDKLNNRKYNLILKHLN